MQINKTLNLYANAVITVNQNGASSEQVVANFSASVSDNQLSHTVNVNVINQPLVMLNEDTRRIYNEQYEQFVQIIRESLISLHE